jgi:hypothetical protein
MMEAVITSETPFYFYATAQCNIPEGCHVHTRCVENLKSQDKIFVKRKRKKVT